MRLREPFNAGSHFLGFLLAALGTWYLLREASGPAQLLAFTVYCATLLLLYGASACYHGLHLSAAGLRRLRTLDHIAIYFLIAGTFTPVAAITLRDSVGPALLAASWAIAVAGIPFKIRWLDAPAWISTGTYLGMGYLGLLGVVPLVREVGPGLAWLVAGGAAYTIGAVIYSVERPDPLPGRLGHHGLWHLFVLAGSACQFAFILLHVARV